MKALLTLSALFVALSLSACGDKHHIHAVDAVEQAQADAIANAPKAETIKFDDENLPKAGSATTDTANAQADTAEAKPADTTATAEAQPAPQATGDNTATASADTASK